RENTNPEWTRERLDTLTMIEDRTVPGDDLAHDAEIYEAVVVDPAVQPTQIPEKQQRNSDSYALCSDVKGGRGDWRRVDSRIGCRVRVSGVGHVSRGRHNFKLTYYQLGVAGVEVVRVPDIPTRRPSV